MTTGITPHMPIHDESQGWIGGEAALGAQAERHVRSQEKHIRGLAAVILGLAFVGGFTMAGALCRLSQRGD
jgi:hypothetical protein